MINRWAFYGLTVLSCGLLAVLFQQRGQYWVSVAVIAIAGFYVVRGIVATRNETRAHREHTTDQMAGVRTTSQKKAVLAELLETRSQLRGTRQRNVLFGVLVAIAAVWAYPISGPIAWAISALLLPVGFMILRHSRAINVIERGLTERGYSYK